MDNVDNVVFAAYNPVIAACQLCRRGMRHMSSFCHRCEVSLRHSLYCKTDGFHAAFMFMCHVGFRDVRSRRNFIDGFYHMVHRRPEPVSNLPAWHIPQEDE